MKTKMPKQYVMAADPAPKRRKKPEVSMGVNSLKDRINKPKPLANFIRTYSGKPPLPPLLVK